MNETNQIIAVFVVRVFFGLLMFMQGYDKLFRVKIKNVLETVKLPFMAVRKMPRSMLLAGVYYTTYVELIGGMLLIMPSQWDIISIDHYLTIYNALK